MAKNLKTSFSLLKAFTSLLLLCAMIMTGCSKEEDSAPKDDMAAIRKEIIGLYLVDGVYAGRTFDDRLVAITSWGPNDLEISGSDFGSFKVTNLFVGYKGSTPDEYTVFAKAVAPSEGNITFAFPKKEVTVVVEIKTDNTTKRTLTLTGTKKE